MEIKSLVQLWHYLHHVNHRSDSSRGRWQREMKKVAEGDEEGAKGR